MGETCTVAGGTISDDAEPTDSGLRRVVRSKGFLRLAGEESEIYFWSLAGTQFSLRRYSSSGGTSTPLSTEMMALRGAEIVFIGPGVSENALSISAVLDACSSCNGSPAQS